MNNKNMMLFQPITINGLTIKNRLVMPSMGTNFANPDHSASQKQFDYIEERAAGGVGLIMMEYSCVHLSGLAAPFQLGVYSDDHIPGMAHLVEIAHRHGAKIGMQLQHGGVQSITGDAFGPSAFNDSREITRDEMEVIKKAFADAAVRAKKAGMDLVELHAAHGYLLNQFMSPYYNKRKDEYGGSAENRVRYPLEVLKAVREAVGPNFPVNVRLSGDEHITGGCSIEDKIHMAKRLAEEGADALHIAGGIIESIPYIIAPAAVEKGYNVSDAEKIKAAVNIPVIVVGKLHDPEYAESLLRDGKADMIAAGRAILVDPNYPNKVFSGHEQDIRKCLYCLQHCIDIPAGCVQNPDFGYEGQHDYSIAKNRRKVLVIGAGPAGLEAAATAARRGHGVILCDKDDKLGGKINIASIPPYKDRLYEAVKWRVNEIERLGVEVRLNTNVTMDLVREISPDAVVVATGAVPFKPEIPGINNGNVLFAADILKGEANVSGNVLIIGGGMVGMETAEHILPRCKRITVVEMNDTIAPDMPGGPRMLMLDRIDGKIETLTNTRICSIEGKTIVGECKGKTKTFEDYDFIIVAAGYKAYDEISKSIAEELPNISLFVAGDAVKARTSWEAIREGNASGLAI